MIAYRVVCVLASVAILAVPLVWPQLQADLTVARDALHPDRFSGPLEGRVLVVGDGSAYGLGVARGQNWAARVASEGGDRTASRLHSRDALRQLPFWLAEVRPERVYLCLGLDDGSVQPTRWRPSERGRIEAWLDEEVEPFAGTPPFVGRFRFGSAVVELKNGGAAAVNELRGTWRSEGDLLELLVDGVVRTAWRYRVESDVVLLRDLEGREVGALEPEWFRADATVRTRIAAERGDYAECRLRAESMRTALHPDTDQAIRWSRWVGGFADGEPTPAFVEPPSLAERGTSALELSIERLVRICRRFGSEVVLVGHPETGSQIDAAARGAAERLGIRAVELPALDVSPTAPNYWTAESHDRIVELLNGR